MRTTYFTTHLQAVSGAVSVVTAHQVAGLIQSSNPTATVEEQIAQLKRVLSHTPPQDPPSAKAMLHTEGAGLDVALFVHNEGAGLLITQGSGIIYLKRAGKLTEVVGDGLIAQGPVLPDDELILTSNEFLDLIGGLEGMEYYFLTYPSEEVVEMMKTYEDQSVAAGFISVMFGSHTKSHEDATPKHIRVEPLASPADTTKNFEEQNLIPENTAIPQDHFTPENDDEEEQLILEKKPSAISLFVGRIVPTVKRMVGQLPSLFRMNPKLVLGAGAIFVFLLVLVASLLFVPRSATPKNRQSFDAVRTQVETLLKSAETEAFVNVSGVEPLIASAKSALEALSPADKRRYSSEIQELTNTITLQEQKHLRISSAQPKEHFVLSLESSDASVTDADFDGETFFLLDSLKGAVYVVSSQSRAYTPIRSDKLKQARAVTGLGADVYVLTAKDGIYHVTKDRSSQVIKPDAQWGTVTDIKLYAGNIYLLDATKKNIFKYSGTDEKTFGTAVSYLVEEAQGNLESNNTFTIDGFVYTAGSASILKFVSGRKADFQLVLPYKDISIVALYTHPDAEKLYLFDASHQALLELTKEGVFETQWRVPDVKVKALGVDKSNRKFIVTEKSILVID